MDWQAESIVGHLRVRTSRAGATTVEHRLSRLLDGADLRPRGILPSSILCIHRLRDPLPRRLSLNGLDCRPPDAWQSAARSRIGDLAARAARPGRGAVPSTADAVLFLDRAELLACLARDWSDGVVSSCWWWRAMFRTIDDAAAVVRAWREAPQQVPAACHLLATWRRLTSFVRRLSAADVVSLTRDVARTFGVDAVDRALAARASAPPRHDAATDSARQAIRVHAPGPWIRYVPEVDDTALPAEPRLLVTLCLILHRAPADARRVLSADVVETILGEQDAPALAIAETTAPPRARIVAVEESSDGAQTSRGEDVVAGERPQPRSDDEPTPIAADADRAIAPFAVAGSEAAEIATSNGEPPAPRWSVPELRPAEAIVETAFGGAFYLINVGIALGLYGDFTTPRSPGIDLPIWDFIALITERLAADDTLATDPILPFLARLAGRDPSEPAGASFVPSGADTFDAWLDAFSARIVARLSGALDVDEDAIADLVIRRAARVTLSPSHLDVAFSLEDLPVEIRLAGLDRNPGFVPAAGLTVTFSYV